MKDIFYHFINYAFKGKVFGPPINILCCLSDIALAKNGFPSYEMYNVAMTFHANVVLDYVNSMKVICLTIVIMSPIEKLTHASVLNFNVYETTPKIWLFR